MPRPRMKGPAHGRVPGHDCKLKGCDVAYNGISLTGHKVTWKDAAGVEHGYSVKKGEPTGTLGVGKLKKAVSVVAVPK